MKTVGVILVGGKSSRMGSNKALLRWKGKSFLQHLINALKTNVDEIYISSSGLSYEEYKLPVIYDQHPEIGPLGGIYSLLENVNADQYIFLSCDTPLVSSEVVKSLINKTTHTSKITLAEGKQRTHPLIGCYPKNIISSLKKVIDQKQYGVFNWLKEEGYTTYQLPITKAHEVANFNTPEDYHKLIQHEHHR